MCKVQVHSLCVLCSLCGGEGTLCFKLINRVEQRSLLFYGLGVSIHTTQPPADTLTVSQRACLCSSPLLGCLLSL